MSDFTKTKIIFAISLLVAAFTVFSIIPKFDFLNFSIFGLYLKFTYLYYFVTLFLFLAVYCYALQFLTERHLSPIQWVADISYAVAIIAFPSYLILYAVTQLGEFLNAYIISEKGAQFFTLFLSVVTGAYATIVIERIIKMMRKKEKQFVSDELEREELSLMERAEKQLKEGYYELSVIDAFKALESFLRKLMLDYNIDVRNEGALELIETGIKNNIINRENIKDLNDILVLRNVIVHGRREVTKDEAGKFIYRTKSIMTSLSKIDIVITKVESFNWLMENYDQALEVIQRQSHPELPVVLEHLLNSWRNRDGSIGHEISIFFEKALIYNTKALFELFTTKYRDQFQSWLDEIPNNIFTDFASIGYEAMAELKKSITNALEVYLLYEKDPTLREYALRVKNKVEESKIQEIL